jgi:hypothetical protein
LLCEKIEKAKLKPVPELAKLSRKSFEKTKTQGKIPCRLHCWRERGREKGKAEMSKENAQSIPVFPMGFLPVSVIRWLLALSPVIPYKKEQTKVC